MDDWLDRGQGYGHVMVMAPKFISPPNLLEQRVAKSLRDYRVGVGKLKLTIGWPIEKFEQSRPAWAETIHRPSGLRTWRLSMC
jgi:hypothetical protein